MKAPSRAVGAHNSQPWLLHLRREFTLPVNLLLLQFSHAGRGSRGHPDPLSPLGHAATSSRGPAPTRLCPATPSASACDIHVEGRHHHHPTTTCFAAQPPCPSPAFSSRARVWWMWRQILRRRIRAVARRATSERQSSSGSRRVWCGGSGYGGMSKR